MEKNRKNLRKSLGYLNRKEAIEYLETVSHYRFDVDVREKFLVPIILGGRYVYSKPILDQYKKKLAEVAESEQAERESSMQTGVNLPTSS